MRLGIDFGGTNLKLGVFNESGDIVDFKETEWTDLKEEDNPLKKLLNFVYKCSSGYKLESGGLSIKGLIDRESGVLIEDIGLGSLFTGVNLKNEFEKILSIPFVVENDARSYAWGEWKFGAGKGTKKMVCMTLGTGVGCALVSDGKPYEGVDSLGGILGGHISIDRNGPVCPCGNIGCLELFCSAPALEKNIIDSFPEFKESVEPLPEYFKMILTNEQKYSTVLKEFQKNLSIGITNVIHAYGPEMVVIGGGVTNSSEIFLPGVIELVKKQAWTFPRGSVKIVSSKLGNKAAAIGAAFLSQ